MSLLFLPFRASAPIERPISLPSFTAVSLLPASIAKESAFPNYHFGADYRIQLPSLHLANLSSSHSSRCRTPIRAVDSTLPGGIRTPSTREPFPGSRRVGGVLPLSCRPAPLGTVQVAFPAYGSSAVFRADGRTERTQIVQDMHRWPARPSESIIKPLPVVATSLTPSIQPFEQ